MGIYSEGMEAVGAVSSHKIIEAHRENYLGSCKGKDNPADLGSRWAIASFLVNSKLWWEDPEWLNEEESGWPPILRVKESNEVAEERRQTCVMSVVTGKKARISNVIDVEKRFNSLCKLLNVKVNIYFKAESGEKRDEEWEIAS